MKRNKKLFLRLLAGGPGASLNYYYGQLMARDFHLCDECLFGRKLGGCFWLPFWRRDYEYVAFCPEFVGKN
jgi:hypothetical protein